MPTNGEKIIAMFPEMRERLQPEIVQKASFVGATAVMFLHANTILGFAFYQQYGITRSELQAAMIVLAAIGKIDEGAPSQNEV